MKMKTATICPSMGWVPTEYPGFWIKATQIETVNGVERYIVEEKTTGEQVHAIYLVQVDVENNVIISYTCIHED
jgi:hypothetical protein